MAKKESWQKWQVAYDGEDVPWDRPQNDSTHWGWRRDREKIDWRPNEPFKAALKFKEMFHGGRSSTHAVFENLETGGEYIMRNDDLGYVLQNGAIVQGLVLGLWRFRRNSGKCSVVPIELISTYDFEKHGK